MRRRARTFFVGIPSKAAALALLPTLLSTLACGRFLGEPPRFEFAFRVHVRADASTPLPGAALAVDGEELETNASGDADFKVRGQEGERREIRVRCPPENQSPALPLLVSLRRLRDISTHVPRYDVLCPPLKRTVVVAARLENGAGFPVVYLDHPIAVADAEGAAHALLQLPPGESLHLTIDTSADPKIEPRNPVIDFPAGDTDDLLLLDQRFDHPREPRKPPRRKRRPAVPIRL